MLQSINDYIGIIESSYLDFQYNKEKTRILNHVLTDSLNGGPSRIVRENISPDILRKDGIFFTNPKLAATLLKNIFICKNEEINFFDPACGAGDLLLQCASKIEILNTLSKTLEYWGQLLWGNDIHEEFIRLTKIRIALLALKRGTQKDINFNEINAYLPNIFVLDSLHSQVVSPKVANIVLNPPYSDLSLDADPEWGQGKVSRAAVFMERFIKEAVPGTNFYAILPDVLRTGSRYTKWREYISEYVKIEKIKVIGKFDKYTDVDVFIFICSKSAINREKLNNWWKLTSKSSREKYMVGDKFNIHVGPLVPHRDQKTGKKYAVIYARDLIPGSEKNKFFEKICYSGKVFQPPFVLIKRTSSPSDKSRANATLVTGNKKYVVENHLIILEPKDYRIETCKTLLKKLRMPQTNKWLDNRIRCRHLTVPSIRELPWWSTSNGK